jgi:ankyrin repeat protein
MKKTITAQGSCFIVFLLVIILPSACLFAKNLDQRLIAAAKAGDAARVENLLARGADVNAREINGQLTLMRYTALIWAAYKGHRNVVKILLAHGADVHAPDSENRTPLMMAASAGHLDIAWMLADAGADIHAKSNYHDTALLTAASGGHHKVVIWLIKKGAAVDAANDIGETALMAAALRGHTLIVDVLLKSSARIDAIDEAGSTALIMASMGILYEGGGSSETVRLLIARGADVNRSNDNGITALIGAASRGNTAVVRELLKAGADRESRIFFGQDKGETALSLALRNNHKETAELLQSYGKAAK